METTTIDRTEDEAPQRRVRTDIVAGTAIIATVVVGNLLWHASDSGLVASLAGR